MTSATGYPSLRTAVLWDLLAKGISRFAQEAVDSAFEAQREEADNLGWVPVRLSRLETLSKIVEDPKLPLQDGSDGSRSSFASLREQLGTCVNSIQLTKHEVLLIQQDLDSAPVAANQVNPGIEVAAKFVDKRLADFDAEHVYTDPDTGTLEYGSGPSGQAKRDYAAGLEELSDAIRSLKVNLKKL